MTSIAAAENLWIPVKNGAKPWLREAAAVTISERIEQTCQSLGYEGSFKIGAHVGHDALLQVIHTHRLDY